MHSPAEHTYLKHFLTLFPNILIAIHANIVLNENLFLIIFCFKNKDKSITFNSKSSANLVFHGNDVKDFFNFLGNVYFFKHSMIRNLIPSLI